MPTESAICLFKVSGHPQGAPLQWVYSLHASLRKQAFGD